MTGNLPNPRAMSDDELGKVVILCACLSNAAYAQWAEDVLTEMFERVAQQRVDAHLAAHVFPDGGRA